MLVVWKLDRLGRTLAHLVNTVQDLSARGVGLRGAQRARRADRHHHRRRSPASSRRWPSSSGAIGERTLAELTAARPRGRDGGRTFALSKAQVRLAQTAMAHRDTSVSALCRELRIRPVTLYRYVGPQGELREQGEKVLAPEPERSGP